MEKEALDVASDDPQAGGLLMVCVKSAVHWGCVVHIEVPRRGRLSLGRVKQTQEVTAARLQNEI